MKLQTLHESEFSVPWYKTQKTKAPKRREYNATGHDADLTQKKKEAFLSQADYYAAFLEFQQSKGKRFIVKDPDDPKGRYSRFGDSGIIDDVQLMGVRDYGAMFVLLFDGDITTGGRPYKRRFGSIKRFLNECDIVDDTRPLDLTQSLKSKRNTIIKRNKLAREKAEREEANKIRPVDAGEFDDEYYRNKLASREDDD